MRPLATPALLRALRLLLLLTVCIWSPAVAPPNPLGVSPYWNNVDPLVHLHVSNNKKSFHLELYPDGKVGHNMFQSPYSALIMKAIQPGYISFIGARSKLNLCMRPDGSLFGTGSYSQDNCAFKQILLKNLYNIFESYKHKILLSLGSVKGPYVPNGELPGFSKFLPVRNEIPARAIYPEEHQ